MAQMAVKDLWRAVPKGWVPRDIQLDIFAQILRGLEEGKDCFIINAPTGSGKSLINITLARFLGDAYILTPSKALQQQYMRDYSHLLKEVKGRSNYFCGDGNPCHKGNCVSEKISPQSYYKDHCGNYCEWLKILDEGEKSPITLFNFYSYICQTKFAKRFTTQRGALIIDEAHNLIETLRSLFDIDIQCDSLEARSISLPTKLSNVEELTAWVRSDGMKKVEKLADLSAEDDESNVFRALKFKFENLLQDSDNYILGVDGVKKNRKYILRRKKVGSFFQNFLDPFGNIKVFSSATILNPKVMCDYLGINWDRICYISCPWPISKEQGPISDQLASRRITYKSLLDPETLPQLANNVSTILNLIHPEERGVIHCVSHKLRDQIVEFLPTKDRIRLVDTLSEYRESDNGVLIGPSFYEGLDLKDDLCRFQILLKIPLPSVADPLVNHLGYEHPEIKDRVVTTIAQAYGRGLRSLEDYCTFYILDGMISFWKPSLPKYMQRAFL